MLSEDFESLAMFIIGVGFIYAAFKFGESWERERRSRKAEDELRRGYLICDLLEQAEVKFREHRTRISEPDIQTQCLVANLVAARSSLLAKVESTPDITAWRDVLEHFHNVKRDVAEDRKRYIVKLSEEEKQRLLRYGIGHPAITNPELAGRLKMQMDS